MQSAIQHGGGAAGEHHGHSPHQAVGRGKPKGGTKGGTPATAMAPGLSAPGGPGGGGSSTNISSNVTKRGLPKNVGMLTGDPK